MTQTYAYGHWPSPFSADLLTAQNLRISEPQAFGDDIFWLESRPAEKGRNAFVQLSADGQRKDLMSDSIRTRAHEYGGSSYLITSTRIFCVVDSDQRIYIFDRANS